MYILRLCGLVLFILLIHRLIPNPPRFEIRQWTFFIKMTNKDLKHTVEALLERFLYDLEMKAREQNRNDKRTEIERFDWFIEQTDKCAWLFIG